MPLTDEQNACVQTIKGPVDISAGAGSGKTFTLTQRIASALKDPGSGVDSINQVLAITFTNKAAGELKGRVRSVLRAEGLLEDALKVDAAWISTIHGMCARILRECALEIGIDPAFEVIDERVARDLLVQSIGSVIGQDDQAAWRNEYRELFEAYPVNSKGPNAVSASSMVSALLQEVSGMVDGFKSVCVGPEPRVPSDLAREFLVTCDQFLKVCEFEKQTKTMVDNQQKIQDVIGSLQHYLSSESQSLDEFCQMLDQYKKPTKRGGSPEFTDAYERYIETTNSLMRQAALALGRPLLNQVIALAEEVQAHYEQQKRQLGWLDNNDLMKLTYHALEKPEVALRYEGRFTLVMVDEFQDTDRLQIAIIRHLAGPDLCYLCTVGDAQQSIYGFRGADVSAYHDYRSMLKTQSEQGKGQAQFLQLTKNFRSHTDVLAFVKRVCAGPQVFGEAFLDLEVGYQNSKYQATAPRIKLAASILPSLERGSSQQTLNPIEVAAQGIADHFEELHEAGHALSEMVVLLRTMKNAETYAQAIRGKGFPCVISGGSVFCHAPEVKLIGFLARALANAEDGEALVKVLSSEMILLSAEDMLLLNKSAQSDGKTKPLARGLWQSAHNQESLSPALEQAVGVMNNAALRVRFEPLSSCVRYALQESGYITRLEQRGPEGLAIIGNILKALRFIEQIECIQHFGPAQTAQEFCALLESAKESPGALALQGQEAIRIMTVHASKGLEFPLVVLADLEGLSTRSASSRFLAKAVGEKVFTVLMPDKGFFPEKSAIGSAIGGMLPEENEECKQESSSESERKLTIASDLDRYYSSLRQLRKRQDAAEAQRLFYVAATRAKESLYLSVAIKEQKGAPFNAYRGIHEDLRAALFGEELFPPDACEINYGGTELLAYSYRSAILSSPEEEEEEESIGAPRGLLGSYCVPQILPYVGLAQYTISERPKTGLFSYSSLAPKKPSSPETTEIDNDTPRGDIDKATDFGSAFHRLGQIAALSSAEEARERLAAVAETYAIADRLRLSQAFENWCKSCLYQRTMEFRLHNPEVAFIVPFDDSVLEGEIDLLCTNDGIEALVVDYKTGGSSNETAAQLFEKHLLQAQCYAYALIVNGYNKVELVFARVEQTTSEGDIQTVSYRFTADEQQDLEIAIRMHLNH